jgi:hypothetical protein
MDHGVPYTVIRADRFQSLVELVRAHRESVIQTNCQDCQEEYCNAATQSPPQYNFGRGGM